MLTSQKQLLCINLNGIYAPKDQATRKRKMIRRVASMIYGVSMNKGEGVGISEDVPIQRIQVMEKP